MLRVRSAQERASRWRAQMRLEVSLRRGASYSVAKSMKKRWMSAWLARLFSKKGLQEHEHYSEMKFNIYNINYK